MASPIVAERIEQRAVSALILQAKNARTHSKAQVAQIVASIANLASQTPVLIDLKAEISASYGRLIAAKEWPGDVLAILAPSWRVASVIGFNLTRGGPYTTFGCSSSSLQSPQNSRRRS